jgi:type IV pilus biogenesis protein CpaD/CtpE
MASKSPPQSWPGGAALTVAVLALLAACTTTPIQSSSAIPEAKSAIDTAMHDGAGQRDPADLAMAQQKLAMAQKSAADGYYDDSRRAAEEAAIDARLASARSQTVAASNALSQLQGSTAPERQ